MNLKGGIEITLSRTQKKKEAEALQKLGERLVALTDEQIAALNLVAELEDAVRMARPMTKHGARRRQIQYIGKLMREVDAESIERGLEQLQAQKDRERRRFKQIEQWRDELVAGNQERLSWLMDQYPNLNQQQLTQLVNQARDLKHTPKTKQAGRQLFRFLAQSIDI